MKEVTDQIASWIADGKEQIALATVITTWGSAPRRPGAKMAIDGEGNIVGSVSGGCVEGAVIEAAQNTLAGDHPQLLHYGVADETAWTVGLACGGTIDVFVERVDTHVFALVKRAVDQELAATIFTVVRGDERMLGKKLFVTNDGQRVGDLDETVVDRLPPANAASDAHVVSLDDDTKVFVDPIRPSPTLVAVGGVDIAIALTKMADLAGYRTIVVDPRRAFGADARFPHVDRLIQKWPRSAFAEISLTGDTAVALLTHDPKIDDPALKVLLDSDVFYIGALGSRKTHARRLQRLASMGFSEQQVGRIFAPIGLDIGADNPQEIAVSIMAQILSVRHGKEVAWGE